MEENTFYLAVETKDRDDCEYLSKTFDVINDPKNPMKGAVGKVYQVCSKATRNCNFVLKVITFVPEIYNLTGEDSKSWSYTKKAWSREVRILKKLNRCQVKLGYKFVPEVYDAWFCKNSNPQKSTLYILMEKFDGNLMNFIKKYKSVPLVKIAAIMTLNSLDKDLHIIHTTCNVCLNDIKLENILYKQIGEYEYQFVFADTGNSSEEITQKCKDDDQMKFRRTVDAFKDGL